jgi:hypothetical protein
VTWLGKHTSVATEPLQTGNVLHRHYNRENNEVVELPVTHHGIGIYVVAENGK